MSFETHRPDETFELAKRLAAEHEDCHAIHLTGDLGAGKTLFTKGIAAHFGIDPADVTSPTFALVNRYGSGTRVLYHIDLYRIEREAELLELGLEEMEEEGALLVVEWPEKLGESERPGIVRVHIEIKGENDRVIRIQP